MNILLISHCNYEGNSALHAHAIALALHRHGHHPIVCIPDRPETIAEVGTPPFPVMTYEQAAVAAQFPDERPADLIHAFTPREHVRKIVEQLCERHRCPYIVHLEDNEQVVVADELPGLTYEAIRQLPTPIIDKLIKPWRMHPVRGETFMRRAAGVTALMDRLLEFKPMGIPGVVFWPGFDPAFLDVTSSRNERASLGLLDEDLVLVYTGNVHASNEEEVRSLILAIGLLRRKGLPAHLLKTGWNQVSIDDWIAQCGLRDFVHDLGFLPRPDIPKLLAAADVLVQPGSANPFNDFRFPSKLPEFLASGRPVILPRTNIGRFLADGENAMLLDQGDAFEIADKVVTLAGDPLMRRALGDRGRQFAQEWLTWDGNVRKIETFYELVLAGGSAASSSVEIASSGPVVDQSIAAMPKIVAMYLPQFHPIPENDEWWGRGFTEWTNVTRAKPNFQDHYQPHLPSDLGFYDLRLPEVLAHQAQLARRYGIEAFCYYYYWFNGRRVLERPIDQMLESGQPDMPFCICWANENWTRRWDGQEHEVLLQQDYTGDWAVQFITDVLPILTDRRYLRVGAAPMLLIYRANILPDVRSVVTQWRALAHELAGLELHLVAVQSFGLGDPRSYGFDAAMEFPPHTNRFLLPKDQFPGMDSEFEGYIEDYVAVVRDQVNKPLPEYVLYRGAMPSWDNTARRGRQSHIVVNSTPQIYAEWIRKLSLQAMGRSSHQQPFIFINAWNEWAEGAHLEPDQRYGHAWLKATASGRVDGIRSFYRAQGLDVSRGELLALLGLEPDILDEGPVDPVVRTFNWNRTMSITSTWIDDQALSSVAQRYSQFEVTDVSYATVADYVDSFQHLNRLTTAQGDLKDVQRPWVLKAIIATVPKGGRVLEIGGGEPYVADLLARLGYEVWLVDPYDGSGNGPVEFETYKRESPGVRFVRTLFDDRLTEPVAASFDCIYSISVLEHVSYLGLQGVFRGMQKFLKPNGVSIHAVDHVHKGIGAAEHFEKLRFMVAGFGLSTLKLDRMLSDMERDSETYYLSAESHNRWRGEMPYEQFPMRVCPSIQMVSTLKDMIGRQ